MTVEITCPNCNLTKKIPKEKIPAGARWATCPRCRHRFELTLSQPPFDLKQEGARPGPESRGLRGGSPWERRSEFGLWKGIYQTFKAVLFFPEKLFSTMAFKEGLKEPLAFGLLLGSIGTMFGFFWQFLFVAGGLFSFGFGADGQLTMALIFLGIMIISPLFVTIALFLVSGILHLLLLIVRGGKNGFEATFRVVSYSQATQVFGLIPLIGGLIGGLWLLIVQIIGLREIHETSYLRIIGAFLIPLVLIFLLVMAVFVPLLFIGSH